MFHIVSGPFHPVLESSLVHEIQELKSANPFTSLALIVPSEMLRRRLQWLLCVEQGLALYDVHFLTFHQLALRLYDERTQAVSAELPSPYRLVSDLTFQQLLREILGRGLLDLQPLSHFRESFHLCAALWSTIRDLKEATIDASTAIQGIDEGLFDVSVEGNLRILFSLHKKMHEEARNLQIKDATDLAEMVIPWVPDSAFLGRLGRVYYYGFYDLSQVQLSLFEAVTQRANVTVYSPLVDNSDFGFAKRFYDRHLSSGVVRRQVHSCALASDESKPGVKPANIKVMNAVGAEDELTFVCKEIGNLIELHGYQFEEIGVVARTLEPYQAWLRQLFKLHRIPFTSSILMPMIHEPGIKSLLQLGSLGVNGFSSRDLLDVVRSPYYRMSRLTNRKEFIQPELWKECIQGLGITRGEEQWRRVSTLAESSAEEMSNRGLRETQDGRPNESKESIQLFDSLVQGLIADCHALPTSGRMAELADAFVALIGKHFILPGLSHEVGGDGPVSSCMTRLAEAIQSLLAQLAQLRCLQETLTWEEWMSLLVRLVKEESVPLEPGPHPGVRVLDAMEARGLPFRALFVLGLNEKVFPRFIREDAFLRDADRRVLAETFGYKIDEKLFGYDEERLIFALLRQAAKDRLYLSYQRADEAGRMLSPSSFLREINRSTTSSDNAQLFSLSRRFSDRLNDLLFRDSLLTVEELGLKLILKGMNPSIVLEHFDRESSLFKQGLISLKGIEQQTREIGSYDGLVGPIDDHWQNLLSRGISPTALEGYARCPYQYYASHLLHVRTVQNQLTDELPPSVIGTLCHAVLNRVYQQFIQDGWPVSPTSSDSFHALIVTEVEYVFAEHAREYSTGYGVIWQHLKDLVNTLVYAEVESSREECLRTKFHPLAVEADAEGYMELLDSRSWSSRFKVYGRLDRVDGNDETGEYRIVDYKFKMSAKTKSEERDLLTSGIRGLSLQPSLYSLMSEYRVRAPDGDIYHSFQPRSVEFVYLAPQRTTLVDRSVFERASWDAMAGQQLKKTMGNLLTGISNGDYFILPGNYCGHCSLSTACRRFHAPTMTRSYRSLQPKQLRHIRKQEIVGD